MNKKEFFKERIDKIAKESFNNEQKQIAKKIIDKTDENDLDAVWGLISQRVKTGFVFDEAPEINHNCIAYIKENEKLSINLESKEALEHALIIGENYDVLKNLVALYTDKSGKGLIDFIYIDPPYNTDKSKEEGNDYKEEIECKNKFIYRDKYTRDGWLNMMNERLKLAKKLLTDDGVIFISIDDKEQAYLKILCDEIFGEENFINNFMWLHGKGKKDRWSRTMQQYILAYAKNKELVEEWVDIAYTNYEFSNPDNDPKGKWFSGSLSFSEERSNPLHENYYTIKSPTGVSWTRQWQVSKEEMDELIAAGDISWGDETKQDGVPRKKIRPTTIDIIPCNILDNCGTTKGAESELKSIIGDNDFDYPKPVCLIKKLISITNKGKAITVLDFFAGSGTTGQAVMELNEEDGGERKFIMATNNENDIATAITRERLYRVINGAGSKGEKIKWAYSKEKKSLKENSVRVFDVLKQELNITEVDKAEKIKQEVENNFAKLKPNYLKDNTLDIYNVLSSLTPYSECEGE